MTTSRIIDTWFPCAEVDRAVRTPAGSGRSEKALFTWFASRPIAQARAAVLCSLLPDTEANRRDIRLAVLGGTAANDRLRQRIDQEHPGKPPVVLDLFSGRGIIPLEAARAGATAIGTDLSPVATLAGRLLADYPLRDWSDEPRLPFTADPASGDDGGRALRFDIGQGEPRLLADVRAVLAEVGRRVAHEVAALYPGNPARGGSIPWAYLWAVTIPCDGCGRRFPLIGSMVLRHPYTRTGDEGQAMRLDTKDGTWRIQIHPGTAEQAPTFTAAQGTRGKSARCPFPDCGTAHTLDVVKAKGFAGQYRDAMLAVAETDPASNQKIFRRPRPDEVAAAAAADPARLPRIADRPAVPDEPIPEGNSNTIQASLFGYTTYGSLMNDRQAVLFATTAQVLHDLHQELAQVVSSDYAAALMGFAAANMTRQLKHSTRGAGSRAHGGQGGALQNRVQVDHVFSSQSVIKHQFDYLEAGPGSGPGTWASVAASLLNALAKVLQETHGSGRPGRFRRASAVALPFRDGTVDAVVCDPPYYDMITYQDSSDLFYVWLKRALGPAAPDLFAGAAEDLGGLQDKADEIIVKSKGRRVEGEHRTTEFYEAMLARAFAEARRVLTADGRLTVIFGHSEPDAWKRLLTALADAGFVVTSSWPSRTETAVTGVATISVTVAIGAHVAPPGRPVGIAAQVDAEVLADVKARCRGWDADGLALEDQLMAAYGAALSVVGRYEKVMTPNGQTVPLVHYMTLARRAVRDAVALRLDELPLETFDPFTRFAVFWFELYGGAEVPKGPARFFAQSDDLRIDDLRGPILAESRAGFRLRHDAPEPIGPGSSVYEVVRGMAAAWPAGSAAAAAVIAAADLPPTDPHLWALVDWIAHKLPSPDPVHLALTAIKRNRSTIQAGVAAAAEPDAQLTLDGGAP
jgi:adenine-specific DNA methylase